MDDPYIISEQELTDWYCRQQQTVTYVDGNSCDGESAAFERANILDVKESLLRIVMLLVAPLAMWTVGVTYELKVNRFLGLGVTAMNSKLISLSAKDRKVVPSRLHQGVDQRLHGDTTA